MGGTLKEFLEIAAPLSSILGASIVAFTAIFKVIISSSYYDKIKGRGIPIVVYI